MWKISKALNRNILFSHEIEIFFLVMKPTNFIGQTKEWCWHMHSPTSTSPPHNCIRYYYRKANLRYPFNQNIPFFFSSKCKIFKLLVSISWTVFRFIVKLLVSKKYTYCRNNKMKLFEQIKFQTSTTKISGHKFLHQKLFGSSCQGLFLFYPIEK